MTSPEAFIWSLVCGLPPGKRERRPIFMLRAYIDDSESSREPPIFILAGYVTHAETWAKFSKDWQMALDIKPRIAYFKMREALVQHGEFHNWSQQLSYERIAIFRQIIERFHLKEFAIRFRMMNISKVLHPWQWSRT